MKIKLIALLVMLAFGGYLFFHLLPNQNSESSQTSSLEDASQTPGEENPQLDQKIAPVLSPTVTADLSEEATIRQFFRLVNDQQIDQALAMMTTGEGENWRAYFEGFASVSVVDVHKTELGSWQVDLDVTMNPETAKEPIPYLGYIDGTNTKFINLTLESGVWKIQGIASGP